MGKNEIASVASTSGNINARAALNLCFKGATSNDWIEGNSSGMGKIRLEEFLARRGVSENTEFSTPPIPFTH